MGTTTNYKWTLPTVHSDASSWGGELNSTIGAIDSVVWNIEKVELAAVQGQVAPNSITITRTAVAPTVPASLWYMNGTVAAGQQARWIMYQTTEAESGGAAGSNLVIQNYDNTGTALGTVVEFIRSTGTVLFTKAVSVTGTLGVSGAFTASAGATVTGQLSVNGNITGNIHYFGWPTFSDFLVNQNASIKYLQWAANWYDAFAISGGTRSWVANGTTVMSLDGGGGLNVTGAIAATSYTTSGTVSANGAISSNASITAAGNITATGTVQANNGLVASKASGSGNANFQMLDNGGTPRGYAYWAAASNSVALLHQSFASSFQLDGSANCLATPGSGGNFAVTTGNGLKPGGGSWGSYSDARIKTVRGDYTSGLEAVLQLRPVTYVYKGEYAADGKEFVGLVADEAMTILPEMVSLQKGTIDGREVDDLKVLDTTALIFALINAVKELKAEIEVLKAK